MPSKRVHQSSPPNQPSLAERNRSNPREHVALPPRPAQRRLRPRRSGSDGQKVDGQLRLRAAYSARSRQQLGDNQAQWDRRHLPIPT